MGGRREGRFAHVGRAAAESSKWAVWIESYHGGPRAGRELKLT